ncbi:Asp-tRNA(Asn)/Glu-tRNA(Gln) amidotransferase subunit GatA [Desulfovibrio sp. OttesenSCG-928-M16]|nr:Asp-tRNA(Asn)/Glu-tRNA(Gln) amidotransferase subunit GatA [Desulfovibrio sp. OttesenSCG-928-M16]
MSTLHTLNLVEIRDRLASGKVAPMAVLEACLARIRESEPRLKACLTVCEKEARARAAELEAQGPGNPAKALWGVPVSVKDVLCTKGVRTTAASRMLEDFIAPYDAHVVERLKAAGAIIVAKTNMDEFAMGSTTEYSAFAPTSNPWDTSRVPGGSSGGSAASVAAMQCFGSLGSDTGGSIRQPAALCGCVGLKPTYGRVSRYGAIAYASSFDQVGPLARSVKDCALLLSVIAGYDERDATCANEAVYDYVAATDKLGLHGMTLGLPVEYWRENLSPEVEKACRAAVDTARDLGATIKEVSLPHLPFGVAAYYILTSAEASTNLARLDGMRYGLRAGDEADLTACYTASRSKGFGDEVQRRILLGTYALSAGYYDAYYTKAAKVRRLIVQDFAKALDGCDALLAPASPNTAWKIGSLADDPLAAYKMDLLTLGLNLAGLPGISLPVGLGESSALPVGMQIFGRAFDEAGIIGIAAALEAALPCIGEPKGI